MPQHGRSSFAEALRDRDNSYMDSYDITIIPLVEFPFSGHLGPTSHGAKGNDSMIFGFGASRLWSLATQFPRGVGYL